MPCVSIGADVVPAACARVGLAISAAVNTTAATAVILVALLPRANRWVVMWVPFWIGSWQGAALNAQRGLSSYEELSQGDAEGRWPRPAPPASAGTDAGRGPGKREDRRRTARRTNRPTPRHRRPTRRRRRPRCRAARPGPAGPGRRRPAPARRA